MYLDEDFIMEERSIKTYLSDVWWGIVLLFKTILWKRYHYEEKPYYTWNLDAAIIKLLKWNLPRYTNGYPNWMWEEKWDKLRNDVIKAVNRIDWDRYIYHRMTNEQIDMWYKQQIEDEKLVSAFVWEHLFSLRD
jgi:hypothetical protein